MGFFWRLFEKIFGEDITRWLKQGSNRVLVVPWVVVAFLAVYYLWPAIKDITLFTQFVQHWITFVLVGAACLLVATIYGVIMRQRPHILLGSVPLVILGLIFIGVGFLQIPRPLPEDKIVVAVALFHPVSDAAKEQAASLRDGLIQELRKRHKANQPLQFRYDKIAIEGATDDECRAAAVRAFCHKAHMVIWAEVRVPTQDAPSVRPWIAIATQSKKVPLQEGFPPSLEPNLVKFPETAPERLAELPLFIHGLAFFKLQRWDEAIERFKSVQFDEGSFYTGLCLYEKAQVSETPIPYLKDAVSAYERLSLTDDSDAPKSVDAMTWAALLSAASAQAVLGALSDPKECHEHFSRAEERCRRAWRLCKQGTHSEECAQTQVCLGIVLGEVGIRLHGDEGRRRLEEAVKAFGLALEFYTEKSRPQRWAMTQNNLGNALSAIGTLMGREEGRKRLEDALKKYNAALNVYKEKCLPKEECLSQQWAMTQNNLGNALSAIGTLTDGEEGQRRFEEALRAYEAALRVRTEESLPRDWAQAKHNSGNALLGLGIRLDGKEARRPLEEAVRAYEAALEVRTEQALPQQCAMTRYNLGIALSELGTRLSGEEGRKRLDEAVEKYQKALSVYTEQSVPHQWAMIRYNLGNALNELGTRLSGEEGRKRLEEAVEEYSAARSVCTEQALPQDWAMIQNNLGKALRSLGTRLSGEEGRKRLEDAVQAYQKALTVYTPQELPQAWAGTQNNLGNALCDLGVRLGAPSGLPLVNEAIRCFDNALSVFDASNFPTWHAMAKENREEAIQIRDSLAKESQPSQ